MKFLDEIGLSHFITKLKEMLNSKVDKASGKQLSTEDYSTIEKNKLIGIEAGANKYTHPTTHPYSMITGTPTSLPANGGNADTVGGRSASDFASLEGVSKSWKVGNITNNVARCLFTGTPTEILIKTKIPFRSGSHMPVIHIQGYAYGLQSPVELKIGYYIYGDKHGWCGAVSMGAWQPEIKLFSYIDDDNKKYTGIALLGSIYVPQFSVGVQIEHSKDYARDWTVTSNMSNNIVYYMPNSDVVNVPYKSTFSGKINGVTFNGLSDITITANPNPHTHDDRYYTESEVNTLLGGKVDNSKVLTNVPANAEFTDTNTITTINGKTGAISKADVVALGIPAQDTVVDISGKADKTELHNHTNKNVLDKFAETSGKPTYNGEALGGDSIVFVVSPQKPSSEVSMWYEEIL